MRALTPLTLVAALFLTLAGCTAHDKAGDKAAAVGDWKTAYTEYRQALADDEKNPQLKARFEEARGKALAQAVNQARACAAQKGWTCAYNEALFALSIDPSNPEMGSLRTDAARYVALEKVAAAEGLIARGDLTGAQGQLVEARKLCPDPAVQEAARAAEGRWAGAASAEAEKLRVVRRYPEAIALAQAAAGYDPRLRSQVDRLNEEFQAYREAEFARLFGEGERLRAQGAWGEAASRFKAAQLSRPDDRARALERYCGLVLQGDQAVARGDFAAATVAYRDAAGLRVDPSGYADTQLTRVAIRPWAVTVRGVLVDAVRPDGTPWVGPPSRRLNEAARRLAAAPAGKVDANVLRDAADVPRDNRPTLAVEVMLPDGRRLASSERDGPYFNLDATFIVAGNGFDKRRLTLRVLQLDRGGPPQRVGEVSVAVGELVSRPAGTLAGPPVLALELQVEPADGAVEGPGRGFSPVTEPPRPAPPPPGARPPPPPPKPR